MCNTPIRPSRTSATSTPLTAGACSGTPRLKVRRPRSRLTWNRSRGAEHEARHSVEQLLRLLVQRLVPVGRPVRSDETTSSV